MTRETMRFVLMAVLYSLALFGAAVLLTGCNTTYDGDGFVNTGRPAKPAKCSEIRKGYIKCWSY